MRLPSAGLLLGLVVALAALGTGGALADRLAEGGVEYADKVVVKKSERKLYLMQADRILASYDIALGFNPVGHKEREGDFRTPEGRYLLDERNPASDFFMSIHVSYPNPEDRRRARSRGVDPGGAIMIHGLPTAMDKPASHYEGWDWTNGCIAVSNTAMVDIWLTTPADTPIEILP